MAITVTDAVVEDFSTPTATSHTQNLSNAVAGDVRVVVIAGNPDGTGTVPTINLPSGWTALGTQTATGAASDGMLWAIYRVVQGGDSGTVTITTTQTCMMATICTTYEGVDNDDPIDATTPTYDVTENPPTSPSITTTTTDTRIIVATLVDGAPGFGDSDIPAGTTLRGTMVNNPPSNGQNLGMADEAQVGIGASGTYDWGAGAGTEEAVSLTVALRETQSVDHVFVVDEDVHIDEGKRACVPDGLIHITENIVEILNPGITKILDETVNINEEIQRYQSLFRILNEDVHITEVFSRFKNMFRKQDSTVNVDEETQRYQDKLRQLDEDVYITELVVNPVLEFVRIINEDVWINETPQRILGLFKQLDETVNVDELVLRFRVMYRLLNEIVNIDEVIINPVLEIVRLINEDVHVDEGVEYIRGRLKQLDEDVHLDDMDERFQGFVRVVPNEIVHITEFIQRNKSMARRVDEAVHILEEIINPVISFVRIINETVNIDDTPQTLLQIIRTLNEDVHIDELVINPVLAFVRIINEDVHITEAVERFAGFARILNETVNINEFNQISLGLAKILNEDVHINDAVEFIKILTIYVSETINIDTVFSRFRDMIRFVPGDNVGITYTVTSGSDFNAPNARTGWVGGKIVLTRPTKITQVSMNVYEDPTVTGSNVAFGEVRTGLVDGQGIGVTTLHDTSIDTFDATDISAIPGTRITLNFNGGVYLTGEVWVLFDCNFSGGTLKILKNSGAGPSLDNGWSAFSAGNNFVELNNKCYIDWKGQEQGEDVFINGTTQRGPRTRLINEDVHITELVINPVLDFIRIINEDVHINEQVINPVLAFVRIINETINVDEAVSRFRDMFRFAARHRIYDFNEIGDGTQAGGASDFLIGQRVILGQRVISQRTRILHGIAATSGTATGKIWKDADVGTDTQTVVATSNESYDVTTLSDGDEMIFTYPDYTPELGVEYVCGVVFTNRSGGLVGLEANDAVSPEPPGAMTHRFEIASNNWVVNDVNDDITGYIEVDGEYVGIVDQFIKSTFKQIAETLHINEVADKFSGFIRLLNEDVHITEEVINPVLAFVRIINEDIHIDEFIQLRKAIRLQIDELVHILEVVINPVLAFVRIINEDVHINDQFIKSFFKQIDETIHILDNQIRELFLLIIREVNEDVHIDELIINPVLAFVRIINETIHIDEFNQRFRTMFRRIDTAVYINEFVVNPVLAFIRIINEDVHILETPQITKTMYRLVNEAIHILEGILSFVTIAKILNEDVHILETPQRIVGLGKLINETVNITELVINPVLAFVRIINETININELTQRNQALARLVNESVHILETVINPVLAFVRIINETVNIDEVTIVGQGFIKTLNEDVHILEEIVLNIVAGVDHIFQLDEIVFILEQTKRITGLIQSIGETIHITEFTARIVRLVKLIKQRRFAKSYGAKRGRRMRSDR